MALKKDDVHFVLCPKQGNKIKGVVLNRVCVLRIFCPKQGQGFKPSVAHLYPNIGHRQVPSPGHNTILTGDQRLRNNIKKGPENDVMNVCSFLCLWFYLQMIFKNHGKLKGK